MTPRRSSKTNAAFTLVELLVVIGIIAVLISVLLPVLSRARQSANAIQCMSNLRQFHLADQMYLNQYGWHMPAWWGAQGAVPNAYNAYKRYWAGLPEFRKALAMPIIPDPNGTKGYTCYVTQKWYCPDALRAIVFAPNPGPDPETQQTYFPLHYSTAMNTMGVDIPTETGNQTDVWDPRATQCDPNLPVEKQVHAYRRSQVKKPAEKLHFCDAMYFCVNVYGSGISPGWHGRISNYDQVKETTYADTNGMNTQRTVAWRHKGGANVVFFDGHGEWMVKTRIYDRDASGNIIRNDRLWKVMD